MSMIQRLRWRDGGKGRASPTLVQQHVMDSLEVGLLFGPSQRSYVSLPL